MGKRAEKTGWVGFDLGATKMLATVVTGRFEIRARRRRKTRAQEGAKACLDRMVRTIEESLEEAGILVGNVAGIGVGCPGPVDSDKGVVLTAPNLGFKNTPLRAKLEKTFGCPVMVINDVDAGIYGEYRFGAARKARCAVGVFPGTGIGGGCVYEGGIIRGKTSSCFEIGHCQVMPEGPLCGCGQRGCLEAVASRLAISAAVVAAAYRGEALQSLTETERLDISNIGSNTLASAIAGGDKVVERIVREAARWLGRGVALAVDLLAADIVVLGGGLVEAMPDLYREEVTGAARRYVMPPFRDAFKVKTAELGDDATALGAAAWARKTIEEKRAP